MSKNLNSRSGDEKIFGKPLLAIALQNVNIPLVGVAMEIAKRFDWIHLSMIDVMSLLVLPKPDFWVGNLVGLIYAAWLGLLIYHSPKWLGQEHFPVKAMFLCMSQESWLFNIFGVLAHNPLLMLNVRENFIDATVAAVAGLIGGTLMQKFLFPKIIPPKGIPMKCDKILLAMLFGIAPIPLVEGCFFYREIPGFAYSLQLGDP